MQVGRVSWQAFTSARLPSIVCSPTARRSATISSVSNTTLCVNPLCQQHYMNLLSLSCASHIICAAVNYLICYPYICYLYRKLSLWYCPGPYDWSRFGAVRLRLRPCLDSDHLRVRSAAREGRVQQGPT